MVILTSAVFVRSSSPSSSKILLLEASDISFDGVFFFGAIGVVELLSWAQAWKQIDLQRAVQNERGAGEGPHTVAPPRAKYPVAPWIEILERNKQSHTKERETPGGQKESEIQKRKTNKELRVGERHACVMSVGQVRPR